MSGGRKRCLWPAGIGELGFQPEMSKRLGREQEGKINVRYHCEGRMKTNEFEPTPLQCLLCNDPLENEYEIVEVAEANIIYEIAVCLQCAKMPPNENHDKLKKLLSGLRSIIFDPGCLIGNPLPMTAMAKGYRGPPLLDQKVKNLTR